MDRILNSTGQRSPATRFAASDGGRLLDRSSGFTLMEVLVAIAVLATTLTVVYQLHGQTMMISDSARFYTLAPMLAQTKLSELEQGTYKDLADTSGEFGEDYPGFRWSIQIEDMASDLLTARQYHLTRIEITVSRENDRTYDLRTYRFYVD